MINRLFLTILFSIIATLNATHSFAMTPCEAVTGTRKCVAPQPFQPASADLDLINNIYDAKDDNFVFRMYGNTQKAILVDSIPFAQYWLLEDETQYIFHPMVYGRFVFNSADNEELHVELLGTVDRVGIELPSGGVAFYYPNHYPLNRMRGPELMYSAISQSEILAGFLRLYQHDPSEAARSVLEGVKSALFFDHLDGGVDLGIAQLEFPSFRSNPEIILNGWLHALLHLNDYAIVMNDSEIASYVETNLRFFSDNHAVWYDEKRNISRYSDTSPQRVVFAPSVADQNATVIYKARDERLHNYSIKPILDFDNEYSAFDVRIVHVNEGNNKRTMVVTCSGLFDTYIVSDHPFALSLKGNAFDPFRATPLNEGEWQRVQSGFMNAHHVARVAPPKGEQICGYPTNFAKFNGKNFYHIQHIVALLYLAQHSTYDNEELNFELSRIATSWWYRTKDFTPPDLLFEEPQMVLDSINRGKVLTQVTDAGSLLDWDAGR